MKNRSNKGVICVLVGGLILVASLLARYHLFPVISGDYTASISHWMDALRGSPGLTAFASPFSNYAPLYLYLLKILTLIHAYYLYSVKSLSFLFDIVMAYVAMLIIKRKDMEEYSPPLLFLAFAVVFAIPTVILNSSAWAQADSIYAAFTLLCLYFILASNPFMAVLMFGIAFCFKLQALFFLPVLIGYLIAMRKSLAYLLIIPAVYLVAMIPALISGGSFSDLLLVYVHQSGEFAALTLSAPSIYALMPESSFGAPAMTLLSALGILLALAAVIIIITRIVRAGRSRELSPEQYVLFSFVSVLAIPFLLPHMHERYFYLADVLSVIYAFYVPRRWYVAVGVVAASFFSYMPFLSSSILAFGRLVMNEAILGVVMFAIIVSLIPAFMRATAQAASEPPGV